MRKTTPCDISFDPTAAEYRGETIRHKAVVLAIVTVAVTVMALGSATLRADDAALPPDPSTLPCDDILSRFEARRFEHPTMPLDYRLLKPVSPKDGERYPLIVWLHGYGREEFKIPNAGQLRWTDLVIQSPDKEYGIYLLATQVPEVPSRWYLNPGSPTDDEPMTTTKAIVDDLLAREPIDPDRIYLVGISSGGTASWEMAMRYPDLFAGAALFGANKGDLTRVNNLVNLPIWVFHYSGDEGIEGEREMVAAIRKAGGTAHLTEVPGTYHFVWIPAFQGEEYDVMNWLLSQDRGAWFSRPPAFQKWKWPEIALQIGLPGIIILSVFLEVRRRRGLHFTQRSNDANQH